MAGPRALLVLRPQIAYTHVGRPCDACRSCSRLGGGSRPTGVSTGGGEILLARYELMCILRPDLDEEGLEASISRVAGLIATAGGTTEKLERWGRRHLAYPINGRTEGFYIVQAFTGTGTISNELTRRLNINEDVLRSIIVRRDLKADASAPASASAPEASEEAPASVAEEA